MPIRAQVSKGVGVGWPCLALALALLVSESLWASDQAALQALSHEGGGISVAFREDRGHVAILDLAGDYDFLDTSGTTNLAARQAVASEYYAAHPDAVDFLFVVTSFPVDLGTGVRARHVGVRNDVAGIHLPLFDNTGLFGSQGKLQSFIDLGARASYGLDSPSTDLDRALTIATHEILHRWAAHVRYLRSGGEISDELITDEGHWSYLLQSQGSLLYGNNWRDNGDGTFTSVDALKVASPLDLYLAGFLSAEEVPPFFLIRNPTIDSRRPPRIGDVVSGVREPVEIGDIVAAEGPRTPGADQAQKEFASSILYLVRPGEEVDGGQLAELELLRRELMDRFAISTVGRGRLEIHPLGPDEPQAGDPDPVTGGPPRPGGAVVEDALAWLTARQAPEGFWQDKEGTRWRDSAMVARALLAAGGDFAAATLESWARTTPAQGIDPQSRRASVLLSLGAGAELAAVRSALGAAQNADGGWGAARGYRSDPLDTALALGAGAIGHQENVAVSSLVQSQNADGSWGGVAGGAGSIAVTADSARVLWTRNEIAAAEAGLTWIASRQNPDGGFGDSPSTAHATAEALLVLREAGHLELVDAAAATSFLASRQTIEGSWEGSVFTTARVIEALRWAALPDWEFSAGLAATPAAPAAGESVRLQFRVRNGGSAALPAGTVRVFDGLPEGGGVQIGADLLVPPLAAGDEVELETTWPEAEPPGAHPLVAVVDPENAVEEADESDNRSLLGLAVEPAPEGPDLELRGEGIAFTPSAPNLLPSTVTVSVTLRNRGTSAVPAAAVQLWAGVAGSGQLVGEQSVAVGAQSAVPVYFPYEITLPGTQGFTVVADPADLVPEAREDNNVAGAQVTTAPSVDLTVAVADLVLLDPAYPGADVRFRATLRNRGTLSSPSFLVRYEVTAGEEIELVQADTWQLGPGAASVFTIPWRVSRTGALGFRVVLDANGLIPELDETNNSASLAFVAGAPDTPNLAISYVDLDFTPEPALEGSALDVQVLLRNTGGVAATDIEVGFFDGNPAQGGTLIGSSTVAALAAGTATPVVFTWLELPDAGDRFVHVVADPGNVLAELDESDNRAFRLLEVLSLPDAALAPGSISLLPTFPVPGQPVVISIEVANLGEQALAGLAARVYLGDPGDGGVAVAPDVAFATVPGGESRVAQLSFPFPEATAAAELVVLVDADATIAEGDESNNRASVSLSVQDSDVFVSERYISPNGDGVRDASTFSFRLDSPVTVAVEIRDRWGTLVRRASDAAWTQALEGSFAWDGTTDFGRVARDGDFTLEVVSESGFGLGQAVVTVDTNRSSMVDAVGTPYESIDNLTCTIQNPLWPLQPQLTADERSGFLHYDWGTPGQPVGIYRMDGQGGSLQTVLGGAWFASQGPGDVPDRPSEIWPSDSGAFVAFSQFRCACGNCLNCGGTGRRLFVTTASGSGTRELLLPGSNSELLGFIDGERKILAIHGGSGELVSLATGAATPPSTVYAPAGFVYEGALSPDRRRILARVSYPEGEGLDLVDLTTGEGHTLFFDDEGVSSPVWSHDGALVALWNPQSRRVLSIAESGEVVSDLPTPASEIPGAEAGRVAPLGYSTWNDELALQVDFSQGCEFWSEYFSVELLTESVRYLGATEHQGCFRVVVSTPAGEGWREIGRIEPGGTSAVRGLEIPRELLDGGDRLRLRIHAEGEAALDVDDLELRIGGSRIRIARFGESAAGPLRDARALRGGPIRLRALADEEIEWEAARSGRIVLRATIRAARERSPAGGGGGAAEDAPASSAQFDAGRPRTFDAAAPSVWSEIGGPWIPNDRALFTSWDYLASPLFAFRLDPGAEPRELLASFSSIEIPHLSPTGRRLLFNSWNPSQDPESACYDTGPDTLAVENWLNLGTELVARREPGVSGVLLSGTAADRSFFRYRLDYALAGGEPAWIPIAPPSTREVFGEPFQAWIPPAPGVFLVRLTTEDRAGNVRSVAQRVYSADTPILTDFNISPEGFSPNGDGVRDEATISYRLLEPANLEFTLVDDAGAVMRTFSRSHAVSGEFSFIWDGRNTAGFRVADGEYRVRVLEYEQLVWVDTSAPVVPPISLVAQTACVEEGLQSLGRHLNVTYRIAPEPRPPTVVERGLAPTPSSWEGASTTAISLSDAAAYFYRAVAEDESGNRAVSQAEPPNPFVYLGAASPQPSGEPVGLPGEVVCPRLLPSPQPVVPDNGLLRLEVLESVEGALSVGAIRVGALPPGGCSNLSSFSMGFAPLATYQVGQTLPWGAPAPDQAFEVLWNAATLLPGDYCVRLEGVDGGDVAWASSVLRVRVELVQTRLQLGSPTTEDRLANATGPMAELYQGAIAANAFSPGTALFYLGEVVGDDPVASVELIVESEEDPRYAFPQRFAPVFGAADRLLFRQPLWEPCTWYTARLEGERLDPDGGTSTISSAPRSFPSACFEIGDATVRPDWATACGETPSGDLLFEVTPRSYSPEVGLALLTLGRLLPNGQEELWTSWNQPATGEPLGYRLDTSELAEGEYRFRARLVNTSGEERSAISRFVVERTPPAVELTHPVEGAQLCAADAELRWSVSDENELLCADQVSPPSACDGGTLFSLCGPPEFWPPEASRCQTDESDMPVAHGPQEVHFEAVGWGGHLSCAVRTVEIDGISEGLAALTGPSLFSPNGDSRLDSTTLAVNVAEAMTVGAAIHPAVMTAVGWQVAGPAVRTLLDDVPVLDLRVVEWDGEDDAGVPVPDGNYLAVVTLLDGCANAKVQQLLVQVDTTPPVVEIDYPQVGDPLPMIVSVRASVADEHAAGFQLSAGAGADPATWALLGAGRGEFENRIVGSWNTFGLAGPHSLRLVAEDGAANTAETRVTVVLDAPLRLLSYLEAVPPLFSPNGDGRREESAIRFGVEVDSVVSARVLTTAGTLVRQLLASQPMGPGAQVLSWNGAAANDAPAPDGEFRIVVDAALAANGNVTQSERIPLVLDRTAPSIEMTRPSDGFASGNGSVIGTIADAHLAAYTVELAAGTPSGPWIEIDAGAANRQNAPLGSLEGLAEGPYWLRIRAEDLAEIRSEQLLGFTVDNTPPVATLEAPIGDSIHAAQSGPIEVRGAVVESNPASWKVELGAGDAPSAWSEIGGGAGAPPAPLLATWSIAGLPDGAYILRLTASDRAGLSGEARVRILVDNTPPIAAISSPAPDAYVRAALPIVGTATDATLAVYTIGVAPEGSLLFSEIASGNAPVSGGTLGLWSALPPDGRYRLRLDVVDRAVNASRAETSITVDTSPPSAPVLQATLESGDDARLHWSASPEPDIAGYELERDAQTIPGGPISETTFLDPDLGDGTHRYVVRAVDRAGWRSAPSNEASISVDRTPPLVRLLFPTNGSRVSGAVEIVGTATSASDFHELRLFVTPLAGGAPSLLARSAAPVDGATIALWFTASLAEESSHRLRLEADDEAGNVAVEEVDVVVDNLPPGPPTNLAATVPGGTSNVNLSWTASSATDVDGYLLYRDGALVNSEGGAPGDLRAFLIRATSYVDASRPDGTFTYIALAMDLAGNLSTPSSEAEATVSRHAPHAVIVEPADGAAIEGATEVVAETADEDVVEARFQFRPLGGSIWADLLPIDLGAPWTVVFDPAGIEPPLVFGDYELRVVARDSSDLVDPGPAPIRVTYTELVPPAPPTGLAARVDAGDVTLTWIGGDEPDLEGFAVERAEGESATWTRLTPAPIPGPPYVDPGIADGGYRYRVLSLDTTGNESTSSNEATAFVHTPQLRQPYTPTESRHTALGGQSIAMATAELVILNGNGTSEPVEVETDAAGRFSFLGLQLALGDNALTVRLVDGTGNRSKAATVFVWSGDRPSAPTGLAAAIGPGEHDVTLAWNPNPEPDILGYRATRNGETLHPAMPVADRTATASTSGEWTLAAAAVDGDGTTYWAPAEQGPGAVAGQWLEVRWSAPRLVSRVTVAWLAGESLPLGAADFDLYGWDGRAWIPLAEVRGNMVEISAVDLARAYRTDRLRLELLAEIGQADGSSYVGVAELRVEALPTLSDPALAEVAPDGAHEYTVQAWNTLGFPSDPSAPATLEVGDVEPPPPVALSAVVSGADVQLTWTPSVAPDLARYDLYRDGAKFAEHGDLGNLGFVDPARPNGTYTYTVRPVDAVGNAGELSNQVSVTVDVAPLPPPLALVVTEVPAGAALDLAWQPAAGDPPTAYRVFRSLTSGGPFAAIVDAAATSQRDTGLANGTTYFYEVAALDAAGNEGARSNEANGTPHDRVTAAPQLVFPTVPGLPIEWRGLSAPIAGVAEPGAAVALFRAGLWAGASQALPEDQLVAVDLGLPERLHAASDGQHLFWVDGFGNAHVGAPGGAVTELSHPDARWSWDGRTLWSVSENGDALVELRPDGSVVRAGAALGYLQFVVPSPRAGQLALAADLGDGFGLYLHDLVSGDSTLLLPAEEWELSSPDRVQWSPDGIHLAAVLGDVDGSAYLQVVELSGATPLVVELDAQALVDSPSWSADGSRLLWASTSSGADQVWTWESSTGATAQLTTSADGARDPQLSPTGGKLAVLEANRRLVLRDLATGAEVLLRDFGRSGAADLEWLRAGELYVRFAEEALRFTPAGRFLHPGIVLEGGTNAISARAIDPAGNLSSVSAPITIEVPPETAPDLAILPGELIVLPQAPLAGTPVRVSVTVRNLGQAAAPESALDVLVSGPGGFQAILAEGAQLEALPAAGAATLGFDLLLPATGGTYFVQAVVDLPDELEELDESNNRGERTFLVAELAGPGVTITSNRPGYSIADLVELAADLTNAGPAWSGRLEVKIEDLFGFEIAPLLDLPVQDLPYGAAVQHLATWPTGQTFAGPYQARATLRDAAGEPVAEDVAAFTIGEAFQVTGRVETDRATYTSGGSVAITGTIGYPSGNALLSGLRARLVVETEAGELRREWLVSLGDLLPGATATVRRNWSSLGQAPGSFRARLEVEREGQVLVSSGAPFDLVAAPPRFAGTLGLDAALPALGDPVGATWSVRNVGGLAVDGALRRVALTDATTGELLALREVEVDLPVGGEIGGDELFSTVGLALRTYLVVLSLDPDGVASPQAPVALAVTSFATADRTPPLLTVVQPQAGGLLGGDLALLATALDQLSSIARVEARIDGGPWQELQLEEAPSGLYGRPWEPLAEGAHTALVRATDAWENVRESSAIPFEVDRVPPVIAIEGVAEGATYTAPVTPVVTVTDLHPGWSIVQLDGSPFASGTVIDEEGSHLLRAVAEDAAGNRAESRVAFEMAPAGEPELTATKVAQLAVDADGDGLPSPGDQVEYTLVVSSTGTGSATLVQIVDPIPAHAAVVAGSVETTSGTITATDPVTVAIASLAPGGAATIRFRVQVDAAFPPHVLALSNQATVSAAGAAPVLTDDPATPEADDPTRTEIYILPAISVVDAEVSEATTAAEIGVLLSRPSNRTTHVAFVTVDGSAVGGADFEAVSGTLSMEVGELGGTVVVPLLADSLLEGAETFDLEISSPENGTVADAIGMVTIVDDEGPPALDAVKSAALVDTDGDGKLNPGDRLRYSIVLTAIGGSQVTQVQLTDPAPCQTSIVPGSVTTSLGAVSSESPVVVDVGTLAPGASATITFDVDVVLSGADPPLEDAISNQGVASSAELPPRPTDDGGSPGSADPTVVRLFGHRIFLDGFESGDVRRWYAERILANGFECGNTASWTLAVALSDSVVKSGISSVEISRVAALHVDIFPAPAPAPAPVEPRRRGREAGLHSEGRSE